MCLPKNYKAKIQREKSFTKHFCAKKTARKMLVKLKSSVNFTNILLAAFKCKDPKSAKRQSSHQCRLALLGSLRVKAVHKMLVKLKSVWRISANAK